MLPFFLNELSNYGSDRSYSSCRDYRGLFIDESQVDIPDLRERERQEES